MAWRLSDRRTKLFIISIIFAVLGAAIGINETHKDAILHNENQQVLLYDMKILVQNQKLIVENQKVFLKNGTLKDIQDIRANIAEHYSDLKVNPATGSPS